MDIYSKERLEQVMNDMKTKVLPQIKSEIEKRAKKNIGIHNEATCSTTAGTAAKAAIAPSGFVLSAGATIIVTFTNAISVANATLTFGTAVDDTAEDYAEKNPATEGWYVLSGGDFTPTQDTEPQNGTTYYIVSAAKPIYYRGAALPANLVKAGMILTMRYNGTQWNIISNIEALDDYLQVNAQNFSNSQKQQARTNIGAQENVTDMAKLGCGIGTCSTSSGTALTAAITNYELVQNGFVAVTFENDVPANATLNINSKGAKPIIYKGSAIESDTIKADDTVMFCYDGANYVVTSLGGGGSANPKETVNISLTQIGGSSADLIGAAITITDDDSGDTLYTATWAGTMLTTEIDVNTNYTVSVETITGYLACADQSYQAVYQNERNITFQYRAKTGAFVEATDGTLYTASTWGFSGKVANSVVLLSNNKGIRIGLTENTLPIHSNATDHLENYITGITDEVAAKSDYNGKTNTDKFINFNIANGTNTPAYAAPYCRNFNFQNGGKADFPSLGQLWMMYQNKTAINECLSACSGVVLSGDHWSSTFVERAEGATCYCWRLNFDDGSVNKYYAFIYSVRKVRPICDYE